MTLTAPQSRLLVEIVMRGPMWSGGAHRDSAMAQLRVLGLVRIDRKFVSSKGPVWLHVPTLRGTMVVAEAMQ